MMFLKIPANFHMLRGSRPKDTTLLKGNNCENGMVNIIQHRALPSHEW
jgi:hypothetical protein